MIIVQNDTIDCLKSMLVFHCIEFFVYTQQIRSSNYTQNCIICIIDLFS